MNAKDAVKIALTSTQHILPMYLGDLSDTDILVRPVPSANHIAWQLGHTIKSEHEIIRAAVPTATYPELPAGFGDQHTKETSRVDPPKGFKTKDEYVKLFNQAREATIAALARLSDADLDKPTTGEMAKFAPNIAAMFILVANHTMMHVGQFTCVRRKLGKPVLF